MMQALSADVIGPDWLHHWTGQGMNSNLRA